VPVFGSDGVGASLVVAVDGGVVDGAEDVVEPVHADSRRADERDGDKGPSGVMSAAS
jgi:hypothetical protein